MLDPATYKIKHDELTSKIGYYTGLRDEASERMRTLSQEVDDKNGDIRKLRRRIGECEDDIREYTAKHEKESKLNGRMKTLHSGFAKMLDSANAHVGQLEPYAATVRVAAAQGAILAGVLRGASYKKAAASIEDSITLTARNAGKFKDRLDALRRDHRTWTQDLEEAREDLTSLSGKHDAAQREHSSYKTKISSLRNELTTLEQAQKGC